MHYLDLDATRFHPQCPAGCNCRVRAFCPPNISTTICSSTTTIYNSKYGLSSPDKTMSTYANYSICEISVDCYLCWSIKMLAAIWEARPLALWGCPGAPGRSAHGEYSKRLRCLLPQSKRLRYSSHPSLSILHERRNSDLLIGTLQYLNAQLMAFLLQSLYLGRISSIRGI